MLEKKLVAGLLIEETPKRISTKRLIDRIAGHINDYSLDILLGPEWLFLPEKRLYTRQEKDDIIAEIAEKTRQSSALIIPGSMMWHNKRFFYNTLPIISQGRLLGEYNKHEDGGSESEAEIRGCYKRRHKTRKKGVFKWADYKLGVEICADVGLLRKAHVSGLDLYFLASCGMGLSDYGSDAPPVRDYGYALHSDGLEPCAQVLQKIANGRKKKYKEVKPAKKRRNISIYELAL